MIEQVRGPCPRRGAGDTVLLLSRKCESAKTSANMKKRSAPSSFWLLLVFCKCTAAVALEGAVQRGTHVVVW